MVQDGSASSTSRKALRPSGNQNECSSATPRSNRACTLGSQEVGKLTLPSCCGALPVVCGGSSCPNAACVVSPRKTAAKIALCQLYMSLLRSLNRQVHSRRTGPESP